MAPYSMRCLSCGEYIYKGRKFNARKETVQGESYYGIKIFRFYIKCTRCSAEITFKTDPKNTDYQAEHGASRNFFPGRDEKEATGDDDDPLAHFAKEERRRELEAVGRSSDAKRIIGEETDPMATLEARQAESKREMKVLDALQDIRTRNAKMDRVDAGTVLERLMTKRAGDEVQRALLSPEEQERKKAEEEDEALVRKYFSLAEDLVGAEEKELKAALAGGGAQAESEVVLNDASFSPASSKTLSSVGSSIQRSGGVVVKRAFIDVAASRDDLDDEEPEAASLLSERARSLLVPSSASSAPPPPKKRKKGANSLGIVRKKA